MSVNLISNLNTVSPKQSVIHKYNNSAVTGTSFNRLFSQATAAIKNLDEELIASQIDLVTGNARDLHTAVLTAEKASLTLDLVVSVRNKAIEAYQEIMRMPL